MFLENIATDHKYIYKTIWHDLAQTRTHVLAYPLAWLRICILQSWFLLFGVSWLQLATRSQGPEPKCKEDLNSQATKLPYCQFAMDDPAEHASKLPSKTT